MLASLSWGDLGALGILLLMAVGIAFGVVALLMRESQHPRNSPPRQPPQPKSPPQQPKAPPNSSRHWRPPPQPSRSRRSSPPKPPPSGPKVPPPRPASTPPPKVGREFVPDEIFHGRVLGLKGRVTFADVKRHYRERMMEYHPDKVAELGPKLRELAESETKKINAAYQFFAEKQKRDSSSGPGVVVVALGVSLFSAGNFLAGFVS